MSNACVYRKMDWEVRRKVLDVCLHDQLFCVVYQALQDTEAESGLSPEEVWCEALGVMRRIVGLPRPDIAIRQEKGYLLARYDTFAGEGGACTVRGQEPAGQTVCTVFTVLLHMLAASSEQPEENPYRELCFYIEREYAGCALYRSLRERIRLSERKEEQAGRYVSIQDYARQSVPEIAWDEVHTLEVDELVKIVCDTHSVDCYEQAIHLLSRYNDHHGHRFQQVVDELRDRLDALRRRLTEPRLTEQVVVQKGGTNISRSHFEGARFGLASQGGASSHKMLDSY